MWGAWDRQRLSVTDSVMLALYDPAMVQDPFLLPENKDTSAEQDLLAIQKELDADPALEVLISRPQNGYLFATVIYDDRNLQRYVDDKYGKDVVQIRPALRDQS